MQIPLKRLYGNKDLEFTAPEGSGQERQKGTKKKFYPEASGLMRIS